MNTDNQLPSSPFPAMLYCGLDEVGRGCLAGPVMAACVHIPEKFRGLPFWAGVTDSKKLSAKKREHLFPLIQQHTVHGIASCSVEEIDRLNILQASLLAMELAYAEMIRHAPSPLPLLTCLVDGIHIPKNLPGPAQAIVKGDLKHLEIAAASILAKVTRDRLMQALHEEFPVYGWNRNAGYGAQKHLDALITHGPTLHHRRSFAPIRKVLAA
ncbi:MAG: ribonuclease HII [Rhodospirillales bacterium]|nr:ribonuclease HII [Rhodospirillales bacterium]MCB9964906.1 ribonuclease HII [Rhodospirillales bacterium]